MPELVTRMAKDIHRRMEATWHAVGERECAPSFLEMDAVKVHLSSPSLLYPSYLPSVLLAH